MALREGADELGHTAFQGGLLADRGEVAHDLAAQGGSHAAENGLRLGIVAQSEDQRRGKDGFAGFLVALHGNFHKAAGIHFQFFANVAVNGQAIAAFSARDERRLEWDAFDFATNGDVRRAIAYGSRNVRGHIDKTDEPYFIDSSGEDVNAVHGGEIIPQSRQLRAHAEMQRDGA